MNFSMEFIMKYDYEKVAEMLNLKAATTPHIGYYAFVDERYPHNQVTLTKDAVTKLAKYYEDMIGPYPVLSKLIGKKLVLDEHVGVKVVWLNYLTKEVADKLEEVLKSECN